MNPDRLGAIRRHAGMEILDVGCGSGAYVLDPTITGAVRGCDVNRFPTWDRASSRFAQASALQLPFRTASFDTVCCFETIEHLDDPIKAIAELARVSSRLVIITVPNCDQTDGMARSNLVFGHYVDPTHAQFFNLASLEAAAVSAGLEVREATLINAIDPWPFLREVIRLPRLVEKLARRLIGRQRAHRMTCLLVGEVTASA